MTGGWLQVPEYARFAADFFILRRERPYVLGLVTNDTCNLHCIDCRVANTWHYNMTFDEVRSHLERYYARGVRFLYLEGGEPYLWRDGKHRIRDVIRLAHDIGYLRVHLYTNGTIPLDAHPDFTWISIDGTGDTFKKIRGIALERVLRNVRGFTEPHAIVHVINAINYREIHPFLDYCASELPDTPVLFYFHTPYYGIDELYLSEQQRRDAVDTIMACKRDGLPVLNSKPALDAYLEGNPDLPVGYWYVVDQTGDYRCCRVAGDPDICRDCGYTTCNEMLLARDWNPEAIASMLRMF